MLPEVTTLRADDDVVDGNVDQFDKEADEAHDGESNSGSNSNLLEFFLVGLGAPLDQPDGILGELLHRFDGLNDLIHGLFLELCEDEGRIELVNVNRVG